MGPDFWATQVTTPNLATVREECAGLSLKDVDNDNKQKD